MQAYLSRARTTLDAFDESVAALSTAATSGDAPLLRVARETAVALLSATKALRGTLDLPEKTAVDIADLQLRLEDESRRLAHRLRALGEAVEGANGAAKPVAGLLTPAITDLEEAAQRVAAALFPSAIEGIREINKALWDVRLIWKDYGVTFDKGVRGKLPGLSSKQLEAVDATARDVLHRFDAVNTLLNDLVTTPLVGDVTEATRLIRDARGQLKTAVSRARAKATTDAFKPFHPVLERAERLAAALGDKFDGLRVPVFPAPEKLAGFRGFITPEHYRSLSGVERFALMNIGARIASLPSGRSAQETLAAPTFEIRVFDVFPDRVYFTARVDFLRAIEALAHKGVFREAPAGLHRFRDGSYKQVQGRKGNLQVSYAAGTPTDPRDKTRISVDADIDLYRGAVSHLFGEVLVNHLTGMTTDQFKVWDTLADNHVTPIGGFDVVSV